jgi:acylpyruvate hydrolase
LSRFASCRLGERRFAALVEGDAVRPLRGIEELGAATPAELLADPPVGDESFALAEVELRPVVPRPGKILCVGLNYRAHVDEGVFEVPDYPVLFPKFADALVAAGEPVLVPPESDAVDYEAELAVVIGAGGTIAGWAVADDVSARDLQRTEEQWTRAKGFDTACPWGPWITTIDELPDPVGLRIQSWVNGEQRQDATTDQLIFKPQQLVDFLAETCTLEPGDLILTGTPAGVGMGFDPPRYLSDGDVVRVEIERLGSIEHAVSARG